MGLDPRNIFFEYLGKIDWRVKENCNTVFCLGTLNRYITGKMTALYWQSIYDEYNKEIMEGHNKGDYHIHDLSSYSSYCFGASLRDLLEFGLKGVNNISISAPAKRLRSICSQISNIVTIFQNENAGAIAFSSWNVYLAPFVYFDKLKRDKINDMGKKIDLEYNEYDLDEITQSVQNMIYALNSNSRMGSEPAFSNITLDFEVLEPMKDQPIIHEGKIKWEYTYKEFQKEANILLKTFVKIMLQGDHQGKLFPYPIPTFNIGKNMDWDKFEEVYELAAKFGTPYFGNFINSRLNESDVYSMCCRLRLDKTELINKTGGLFGAAEKTGSIGVFTINLPAIAYRNKGKSKEEFFNDLKEKMLLGKEQLEIKRKILNKELERGLYPAMKTYLGKFDTLFSTIGFVGCHEMCLNYLGVGIETKEGKDFTITVLNFMRETLKDFQNETGNLYNLEFTPAESASYRLAKKDKERYPDIITSGKDKPYYTNSAHLPVNINWSYKQIFEHQHGLLSLATGGSVYHLYLKESPSPQAIKRFLQGAFKNYDIPYISFSPIFSICDKHGYIKGKHETCPTCGEKTEIYQRITGYIRAISNFNDGKLEEFKERNQKVLEEI